jgi:LEA14-like dessication related protein
MNRYSPIFLALLVFILFASCNSVKDLEFKEIKNVRLEKLGFAKSTLSAEVVYYNPNNFSLELNQSEFDVYINNNLLGHSSQLTQVKVPNRQAFSLPIHFELDMKNLLKNGVNGLIHKEVEIRAVGKIKAGKAGLFKILPVDFTTKQQLSLF